MRSRRWCGRRWRGTGRGRGGERVCCPSPLAGEGGSAKLRGEGCNAVIGVEAEIGMAQMAERYCEERHTRAEGGVS